jgi:hypothetical protein
MFKRKCPGKKGAELKQCLVQTLEDNYTKSLDKCASKYLSISTAFAKQRKQKDYQQIFNFLLTHSLPPGSGTKKLQQAASAAFPGIKLTRKEWLKLKSERMAYHAQGPDLHKQERERKDRERKQKAREKREKEEKEREYWEKLRKERLVKAKEKREHYKETVYTHLKGKPDISYIHMNREVNIHFPKHNLSTNDLETIKSDILTYREEQRNIEREKRDKIKRKERQKNAVLSYLKNHPDIPRKDLHDAVEQVSHTLSPIYFPTRKEANNIVNQVVSYRLDQEEKRREETKEQMEVVEKEQWGEKQKELARRKRKEKKEIRAYIINNPQIPYENLSVAIRKTFPDHVLTFREINFIKDETCFRDEPVKVKKLAIDTEGRKIETVHIKKRRPQTERQKARSQLIRDTMAKVMARKRRYVNLYGTWKTDLTPLQLVYLELKGEKKFGDSYGWEGGPTGLDLDSGYDVNLEKVEMVDIASGPGRKMTKKEMVEQDLLQAMDFHLTGRPLDVQAWDEQERATKIFKKPTDEWWDDPSKSDVIGIDVDLPPEEIIERALARTEKRELATRGKEWHVIDDVTGEKFAAFVTPKEADKYIRRYQWEYGNLVRKFVEE